MADLHAAHLRLPRRGARATTTPAVRAAAAGNGGTAAFGRRRTVATCLPPAFGLIMSSPFPDWRRAHHLPRRLVLAKPQKHRVP